MNNPIETIEDSFLDNIKRLNTNNHISDKLYDIFLDNIINNNKKGRFRILPKLHKTKLSIRPIINCRNTLSNIFSKLIDFILKSIVIKQKSYTVSICKERQPS
jgi:hypothetical protein